MFGKEIFRARFYRAQVNCEACKSIVEHLEQLLFRQMHIIICGS